MKLLFQSALCFYEVSIFTNLNLADNTSKDAHTCYKYSPHHQHSYHSMTGTTVGFLLPILRINNRLPKEVQKQHG